MESKTANSARPWARRRAEPRLGSTVSAVLGAALLLATTWGCSRSDTARESALVELEQLAFVPRGSTTFLARVGPAVVCENDVPLLVDRFEVSRSRWMQFQSALQGPLPGALTGPTSDWPEESGSWAASWMDLDEARACARSRGMRLPTAREWLRIASGTRGLTYPWGSSRAFRVANTLELALGRPTAGGTFELGATPLRTYDMCGNVWEWVEAPIEGLAPEGQLATPAWAMGGAFTSPVRRLWDVGIDGRLVFERLELDPAARGEDVGLRCVVDAREYLLRHARDWGEGDDVRHRLLAVGRSFGRDAVPLLEELARESVGTGSLSVLLEGARGTSAERAP